MFYNNLKIAIRTLLKNKVYTGINILGLMVGIAAVLLIYRMVSYELSFNKSFSQYEHISRVVSYHSGPSGDGYSPGTPVPAMLAIRANIPQLEKVSRVRETWATLAVPGKDGQTPKKKFTMGDNQISFFADPEFIDIFQPVFLAGDPKKALNEPGTVLLNKTWAIKLFDQWESAMGQIITFDNIITLTVKGVFEDMPVNTDFPLTSLVSYKTAELNRDYIYLAQDDNWGSTSSNDQVYVLTKNKEQWEAANEQLKQVGQEQYQDKNGKRKFERYHYLQPLSELHYNQEIGHSGTHQTSHRQLQILSFVGLLILLIASFNFINLSTAQATQRAKEVGVRKTLGGRPIQLIGQFMSETAVIVFTAMILGIMLAQISHPLLQYISDVPSSWPFMADGQIWLLIISLFFIITLLAGLYPAFVLSSYRPVEALSRNIKTYSLGGLTLQRGLVVAQFVISSILIIGAIISIQQMSYIQNKSLGFEKDLVYTFSINNDSTSLSKHDALKNNLLAIPGVQNISMHSDQPFSGDTWQSNLRLQSRSEDEDFSTSMKFCDDKYLETFGLELLAGKWLSPSDTFKNVVVNEYLVTKLGLNNPEEALNLKISIWGKFYPVVGVVKDFHSHSFHQKLEPLTLVSNKDFFWYAAVKLRSDNVQPTLAAINKVFDQIYPEQVLSGRFMDEKIQRFYEGEKRIMATCQGFGLLAIFISCLGLLGLAMHAAARRTKEIGVRKVLGASVQNIISLLSKDFILLVIIALLIATPIAWYAMSEWLNGFAYRINIQWWIFLLAGVVAVTVAFITVGIQGFRAAVADPINALRNE